MKCSQPLYLRGSFSNAAQVEEKVHLMIGKPSDSGYDSSSISIYEIFIVACSTRGIPAGLMR
jgi:hypothetical protein